MVINTEGLVLMGAIKLARHRASSNIFSFSFLQEQFTNQRGYKEYSLGPYLRIEHWFAGDLGQPDNVGDLGQPPPCCHRSIKLARARRRWNWNRYIRQE